MLMNDLTCLSLQFLAYISLEILQSTSITTTTRATGTNCENFSRIAENEQNAHTSLTHTQGGEEKI